jgi:hypothetical protein
MSNIERYVADQTEGGDEMVLDTSRDPARVVCMCRTDEDADTIARALNNQGAVEALREAAEALDWAASKITDTEANQHVRVMAVKARDAVRGQ